MRKLTLPLAGFALVYIALLVSLEAQAGGPAITSDIRATLDATSTVEKAACVRRRVCGPRGCVWRTVCRRWR
jgi:hypothetical protein